MAHVKAYGAQAKSAMPIIHLGATSCFVNCNSEIIMIDDALNIIQKKLVNVMDKLKRFADARIYAPPTRSADDGRQTGNALAPRPGNGL